MPTTEACYFFVIFRPCCRAGLLLILSAALELADQPTAAQPAILVLPLAASSSGGNSAGMAGGAAAQAQRRQQQLPPLAVECREPLTCVLLAGGNTLLAAGEAPEDGTPGHCL